MASFRNGVKLTLSEIIRDYKQLAKSAQKEIDTGVYTLTELAAYHDRDNNLKRVTVLNSVKSYIKNSIKQDNCRNTTDFNRFEKLLKKHLGIIRKHHNGNAYDLINEFK